MKSAFFKSPERPQTGSLVLLFVFCLLARVAPGADSIYKNTGSIIYLGPGYIGNTVAFSPQIDATNFYNSGTMELLAYPLPYMTSHTRNYTNTSSGFMLGYVGWEFDYGPLPTGGRGMSANFVNNGTIEAFSGGLPNPLSSSFVFPLGYLWVSATNIVNKNGTLMADADCEIKLAGKNVNLSRSTVEILPTSAIGSSNGRTNFFADTAIYDEYWGQTNMNFNSGAIWNGINAASPFFLVNEPCGVLNVAVSIGFTPAVSDSISNAFYLSVTVTNLSGNPPLTNVPPDAIVITTVLVATNIFRQAAFVNTSGSDGIGAIHFLPTADTTNLFETVAVRLESLASGDTVYLVDTLASSAARGLLPNTVVSPSAPCSGATFRPTNYIVARIDPGAFGFGTIGMGTPPPNFLYDTSWTNLSVTAVYAGYSCLLDNQASEPPPNPDSGAYSVTNLPGRIHIYADSLNLTNMTMRAEGEIVIQANHLIGSQNAVMDCENLSYNLGGTTNGGLNVTNLALPLVTRFHGTVSAWSAVWSNQTVVVITNNYSISNNVILDITNNPIATNIVAILAPLTNTIQINLYALLVDGSGLSSQAPVTVYDLILHSTNMVISDSMNVIQSFLLDGRSFTLNGSLIFPGSAPINPVSGTPFSTQPIRNWIYTNAPTLRYFTNNGFLSIPNEAHFGDDGPTNYAAFVNTVTGTIDAYVQTINSDYFENDGALNTSGGFSVTTLSGKFQNGQLGSGSDIQFFANDFKFDQSSLQASSGELDFTVTNSLSDTGGGSGNSFTCDYGFNLWIKPRTGDLLGTTIRTVALNIPWVEIDHFWAGTNCGPSNRGYSNNVALGQLVLAPQGSLVTDPPQFFFAGATGAGVTNGLYVDLLDLRSLGTNWDNIQQNLMQIDSSLVIYYAAAKLGFTPPPTASGVPPQEPEEFLDGQFGGHLRWVKTFAGPNSSIAVVINGQSYLVNKALRNSKIIDSNTNGIPNYYDPNPFSTPPPFSTMLLTLKVSLVPQGGQLSPKFEMQTNQLSSSVLALSWLAASNTVYYVQFATNLAPANWQPLLTCTNNAPTNQMVTVFDTNAPAAAFKRFYRVGYGP